MVRTASQRCQTRSSTTSHELGGAVSSNDAYDEQDLAERSDDLAEDRAGVDGTRPELVEEFEAHLTVAAVAARLGVAASTLRTWDRRYGLGPSQRQAGSHRRYSPDDLARLETMRALSLRGVALGDAARMALRSAPAEGVAGEDLDPLTLAAAAVDSGHERLVRALRASVAAVGLVETYASRLLPALDLLADASRSDAPGHDPRSALAAAFLGVVRERTAGPVPVADADPLVLVRAPAGDVVAAHVLAGSLHEAGVRSRVAPVGDDVEGAGRFGAAPARGGVVLVVELHLRPGCEASGGAVGADASVEGPGTGTPRLLLVGPYAPDVPGSHRVRTLAAAVPEATDLAREGLPIDA